MKGLTYCSQRKFWTTSLCAISHVYHITVKTGDVFGAGTDAGVFVRMIGEEGSTSEIKLKAKKREMERGMTNKYKIFAEDVGKLNKLIIRHDNTGIGPAWYLEEVNVVDREGRFYVFECNDWLIKSNESNIIKLLNRKESEPDNEASEAKATNSFEEFDDGLMSETPAESFSISGGVAEKGVCDVIKEMAIADQEEVDEVLFDDEIQLQNDYIHMEQKLERVINDPQEENIVYHTRSEQRQPSKKLPTSFSPAVRMLLDTYGIRFIDVPPTGPHNRLLKGDVLLHMRNKNIKDKQKFSYTPPVRTGYIGFSHVKDEATTAIAPRAKQSTQIDADIEKQAHVDVSSKYDVPHLYFSTKCDIENFYDVIKNIKSLSNQNCMEVLLARLFAKSLKDCKILPLLSSEADIRIKSSSGSVLLKNCLNVSIEDLAKRFLDATDDTATFFSIHIPREVDIICVSDVLQRGEVMSVAISGVQLSVNSCGKIRKTCSISLTCDASALTEEESAQCLERLVKYITDPEVSAV